MNSMRHLQTAIFHLKYEPYVLDIGLVVQDQPLLFIVPAVQANLTLLAQQIAARLSYCIPENSIFFVSTIPLSSSGAIDEQALLSIASKESKIKNSKHFRKLDIQIKMPESRGHYYLPDLFFGNSLKSQPSSANTPKTERLNQTNALALCDGGSLDYEPGMFTTLNQAFIQNAQSYKDKKIHYISADGSERQVTFASLFSKAKIVLGNLQKMGIKQGDIVIIQCSDLWISHTLFWGCMLGGIIFLNIQVPGEYDHNNNVTKKLLDAWLYLDKPLILAGNNLMPDLQRLLGEDAHKIIDISSFHEANSSELFVQQNDKTVIFIQLSSGSTGMSKCIPITNRGIVDHILASQRANNYTAENVSLNWLPFDHVVPMLTCHFKNMYLGCEQIEIPTQFILANPLLWLSYIAKYQVTHTWAPNFGFKLVADALLSEPGFYADLSSLQYVMNAGEQVTFSVMESFYHLCKRFGLHLHALQPAFGMAEACTCMTYHNHFSLDKSVVWVDKTTLQGDLHLGIPNDPGSTSFVKLGSPVPGVAIRIVDEHNQVLPEGCIGKFQIKGSVITPGYLNNEKENALAFVGDGWFNSGDLGFIIDQELVLSGRSKETIILNGANFYCHELEDIIEAIEGVKVTHSIVCGIQDPQTGSESLAIFFVPENTNPLFIKQTVSAIRTRLTQYFGVNPRYILPLASDQFPKTTSGKKQRTKLSAALEKGELYDLIKQIDDLFEDNQLPAWFFQELEIPRALAADSMDVEKTILVFVNQKSLFDSFFEFAKSSILDVRVLLCDACPMTQYHNLADSLYAIYCFQDTQSPSDIKTATIDIQAICKYLSVLAEESKGKRLFLSACYAGTSPYAASVLPCYIQALNRENNLIHANYLQYEHWPSPGDLLNQVFSEIGYATDQVSFYRQQMRWVSRLSAFDPRTYQGNTSKITQGGCYIVIGGLGDIGQNLCRHLLTQYQCRLLIIGRTEINQKTDSVQYARFSHLHDLSEQVDYIAVPELSSDSLLARLQEYKANHGIEINGIIYAAGYYHESLFMEENWPQMEEAFKGKIYSLPLITELLQKLNPNGLLVILSSILSRFINARTSAYASANNFANQWCQYVNKHSSLSCFSLAFSNWAGVGMSKNIHGALMPGLDKISVQNGIMSFDLLLRCPAGLYYVGLNDQAPMVSSKMNGKSQSLSHFVVVYSHDETSKEKLQSQFDFMPDNQIEFINSHEYEHQRLAQQNNARPLSELEQKIKAIWEAVLFKDSLPVNQSFFELGGNSILLASILDKLTKSIDPILKIQDLFAYPTIAALSHYVLNKTTQKNKSHLTRANKRHEQRTKLGLTP